MMKFHTKDVSMNGVFSSNMVRQDSLAIAILKLPVHVFNMLLVWQERATTRAGLRELDARFLADVGLSKKEAYIEGRKPFWLK